jgi:predicted Rossmann fold nucleotide-binding protein DprA/Smf involved in DNA uptake
MRAKSKQLLVDDHRGSGDNVVIGSEVREITAPSDLKSFFHGKPPSLWCRGDLTILNHKLLGIVSSRQIDSDLASESSQFLKQLGFMKDVSFVGGWHSPLEKEALRLLLAKEALIIVCTSKALHRFIPSIEVGSRVIKGQALLLTHCSPKAKRITRDASMRRNELVVELAKALLVLSAPEGSASLNLARSALRQGKTVHTLEHRLNKELLIAGAVPATLETIKEALR